MTDQTAACVRRPHSRWTTCPCPPCTADRARMAKLNRVGRLHRPSSDQAIRTFRHWLEQGYSPSWIASAAGVPIRFADSLRQELIAGRRRGVGPVRAGQLIALRIGDGTTGHGPADGTMRRLRALARAGYALDTIAAATGVPQTTLSAVQRGLWQSIRNDQWRAVRDFYDHASNTTGPNSQAATRARNKGWHPAAAWDDDTIDDPTVTVTGDARSGVPGRRSEDTVDDAEFLLRQDDAGHTYASIGARLGLTGDGVEAAVKRVRQRARDTGDDALLTRVEWVRDRLAANGLEAGHAAAAKRSHERRRVA